MTDAEKESIAAAKTASLDGGSKGVALTCITCRMRFDTPKEQREHYKEDLHRFNLKRKVANLAPVSQQLFDEKASNAADQNAPKETESEKYTCGVCNKTYNTSAQLDQHNGSKKHKDQLKKPPTEEKKREPKNLELMTQEEINNYLSDAKNLNDEERDFLRKKLESAPRYDETRCLFCNASSGSLDENVTHMTKEHGFFIPDIEYLKDLGGLLRHLGEKILVGNECIWCNEKGKAFQTAEAAQGHMRGSNHCKILYEEETEEEFEDYYDFSSEENTEGEITSSVQVADNGIELVLRDGRLIGHRALRLYYQQKLRLPDTREAVVINNMVNQYRMLGWNSSTHMQGRNSGDRTQHPRQDRRAKIFDLKIGTKLNNQKHHRDQMNLI